MYKPDNESRTTSQVSIDDDLTLHLQPGVYFIDALLDVACESESGFKFGFIGSAEIANNFASLKVLIMDLTNETVTVKTVAPLGQLTIEVVGSDAYGIQIKGAVSVEEAGTFSLCWSQSVESESPTTLGRGSYIKVDG